MQRKYLKLTQDTNQRTAYGKMAREEAKDLNIFFVV
jgi:hypothetical protein